MESNLLETNTKNSVSPCLRVPYVRSPIALSEEQKPLNSECD
jgi:hypothetical protein